MLASKRRLRLMRPAATSYVAALITGYTSSHPRYTISKRDVEDDRQTHIGDPAVALEQPRDERCGEAHEGDRQDEAEDQDDGVPRAAPATASTLSSDIDTSAIRRSARRLTKVLRAH